MWILFALLSAVFYSTLWVAMRASQGISSSIVTAANFILGPVLVAIALPGAVIPWGEPLWWVYLAWMFVINPGFSWMFTHASQRTPLSIGKPLSSLSSVTAMGVGFGAFGTHFPPLGIAGVLLGAFGLLLLYHGRWAAWSKPHPWIVAVCMISFGINTVITAHTLVICPNLLLIIGLGYSGSLMLCSTGVIAKRSWRNIKNWQWWLLGWITFAALIQEMAGTYALTLAPAAYVISVKRVSILMTSLVGYICFHERDIPLWRLIVALLVVIAGVVMLVIS